MKLTNNQVLTHIMESRDLKFLVTILELSAHQTGADTISAVARKNGISRNGVLSSKRYRKLKVGSQQMAVSGLRDVNVLPW